MRKLKEGLKSGKRGITLIALVVTIIVLLILAGVSIAMLTGDNGILTQAQNAKVQTEIGKAEELANLAHADLLTDQYSQGTAEPTLADIKSELERLHSKTNSNRRRKYNRNRIKPRISNNGTGRK